MKKKTQRCLYRYDYHPGMTWASYENLYLYSLPVLKQTPRGFWVEDHGALRRNKRRFVLENSRKKYAATTPKLALESFIAKKESQIGILTAQLEGAKEALKAALQLQKENNTQPPTRRNPIRT